MENQHNYILLKEANPYKNRAQNGKKMSKNVQIKILAVSGLF